MALGCPLSAGLVAAGAALLSDEITSTVLYFVLKEKPVPPNCHGQGVASGSTWGLCGKGWFQGVPLNVGEGNTLALGTLSCPWCWVMEVTTGVGVGGGRQGAS